MENKFLMGLGLWVNPDFSEAEAGRSKPPRVNHDRINFGQLRTLIQSTFTYGPPVDILVPNDTVDQVTAHFRMGMFPGVKAAATPDLCACRDFGEAMRKLANNASDGVVDVRNTWKAMHATPVRDRSYAPPPSLLPFLLVASDFEDAMIWQASTLPVLGLKPFDPLQALTGAKPDVAGGRLPKTFLAGLRDVFGCSFQEYPAMLDRLSMDKPPAEFGLN